MKKTLLALSLLMALAVGSQTTFAACPVHQKHMMIKKQHLHTRHIKHHNNYAHKNCPAQEATPCPTGSACPVRIPCPTDCHIILPQQCPTGPACPCQTPNCAPSCNDCCD